MSPNLKAEEYTWLNFHFSTGWPAPSTSEEHKQKVATCEANNGSVKEDIKVLRDWNKEMNRQIQELREKVAAKRPE
jgi:hypothetical protein